MTPAEQRANDAVTDVTGEPLLWWLPILITAEAVVGLALFYWLAPSRYSLWGSFLGMPCLLTILWAKVWIRKQYARNR